MTHSVRTAVCVPLAPRGGAILHALFASYLASSLLAAAAAFGQAPEQDVTPVSAALPESNEAAILTAQVEQALQFGDYRLAISLTRRIAELPEGLVAVPGARTYYPVWRQALRLLAQLPPEASELYRQMYDAQVRAELDDAAPRGDLPALRRLFRTHRASGQWEAVGGELAAQLIDRGEFGEAIDVLRVMSENATSRAADVAAQLAVALGHVGATRAAGRTLERLATELRAHPQPGWPERLALLQAWLGASAAAGRGDGMTLEPLRSIDANWSLPLTPASSGVFDNDDQVAETMDTLRRLPLIEPVLDDDMLFVRGRGTLWAIDALTLTLRWRMGDMRQAGGAVQPERHDEPGEEDSPPLSDDASLLFSHALRHAISTGFGKVFTIEGLTLADQDAERFGWQGIGNDAPGPVPNALVARDRADGQIVWRAGVDADDPLFGVAFQDAPLIAGGAICTAIQRGNELRVCLIDPESGKLRSEVMVVGPPTAFSALGGRCLLTCDETTVYLCTGNGVVAALSRDDLSWKWAAVYPGTRQERRGRWRWMPSSRIRMHSLGAQRPLIAEDLLIVCPPDAPFVFAFDRFNGRQVWPPIERSAFDFVVGPAAEGLLVAGNSVVCLDLADGHTVRWRSVTMEIAGRPCVASDRVYVPTTGGLVTLDARTGRVLDDAGQAMAESVRRSATPTGVGAALLTDGRALYGVSPNGVFKQPDAAAARAQVDELLAAAPADARAVLADAWLKLLSGHDEAALDALRLLQRGDAQVAAACDRLLTGVFLALARKSPDAATRLDWLKRAATLSPGPDGAAAGLMLYVGRTLEESGQLEAATAHYCDMLSGMSADAAIDRSDPRLRRAGWSLALERLDALLAGADGAVESTLSQRAAAAGAARDYRLLRRLRGAALPERTRAEIDAALAASDLPYELAFEFAESAAQRGGEPGMLLERWAAHVALGRFAEAQQDQARCTEAFGAGVGLSDAERSLLARVQRDMEKLVREQTPPFDPTFFRPWRLPASELLLPIGGVPRDAAFVLARSLSDDARLVRLVSVASGQTWRSWTDGLERHSGAAAITHAFFNERLGHGDVESAWPVATFGALAAAPVAGGLIGVGLAPIGPEKRAGTRLWEYPLPEWGELPPDFHQVCAVGPEGVCLLTPRRRLVLLDWHDGHPIWERELGSLDAVRIARAGQTLVILDRDDQLSSLAWRDGRNLDRFQSDNLVVHDLLALENTVIVWSDLGVTAIDAQTREVLWTHQEPTDDLHALDAAGGCLALHHAGGGVALRDVHSGEALLHGPLPDVGDLTAVARSATRAYLAGIGAAPGAGALRSNVQICCVELPSGRKIWSNVIESLVPVTWGALTANPQYIPVLIERSGADGSPEARVASLAIQLIERESGRALEPLPISEHFRNADTGGPTCLLTTSSRMIVQFGGSIAAFGLSRTTREP
ncbi:outer membrane biogenesis protein BamB [Phycisphaerae bacterium RAS1]|nr:outer membrane biogenesis protein BamB [Phycisphaerae bacterium RAS1]